MKLRTDPALDGPVGDFVGLEAGGRQRDALPFGDSDDGTAGVITSTCTMMSPPHTCCPTTRSSPCGPSTWVTRRLSSHNGAPSRG